MIETLEADIDLAYRTLQFIGELKDEQIPAAVQPKMKDIVANLCDFQYRFSRPMELPFGLGDDLEEALPTPRPVDVLLRFKYAYPVEDAMKTLGDLDDADRMRTEDGKEFCFSGQKTWASMVAQGKLKDSDASAPEITTWLWLPHLFSLFEAAGAVGSLELRHKARRLAACWYHIATQASFEPDLDEEEAQADAEALADPAPLMMQLMMSGAMGGMLGAASALAEAQGGDDDDEEGEEDDEDDEEDGPTVAELLASGAMDDEDEDADNDYNPAVDPDDGEDVDEMSEDEDQMDTDDAATESFTQMLAKNLKLDDDAAGDDDDDDADFKPEQGDDDDDADMPALDGEGEEDGEGEDDDMMDDYEEPEETEEEKQFRASILKCVDSLNAVYPDPSTDLIWVKRTLKHAAASMHDPRALSWFPWGIPPVEPLTRCVRSEDPFEKQYGITILALYQQHLMPETEDVEDQ